MNCRHVGNVLVLGVLVLFVSISAGAQEDTLVTWCQTTWHLGPGYGEWTDTAGFRSGEGVDYSDSGCITIEHERWAEVSSSVRHVYSLTEADSGLFCGTDRKVLNQPTIFRSPDGFNWSPAVEYPIVDAATSDEFSLQKVFCLLTASNGTIYAGGLSDYGAYSAYVIKSTDGGLAWANTGFVGPQGQVRSLHEAPDGAIYCGTECRNAGVYRSTDEGDTWASTDTLEGVLSVEALCSTGDTLYVSTRCQGSLGRVFRSTDGGADWDSTATIPEATWAHDLAATGSMVWVGVTCTPAPSEFVGAVYRSDDGGEEWQLFTTFESTSSVTALLADRDSVLYFGSSDGHVWRWSTISGQLSLLCELDGWIHDMVMMSDTVLVVAVGNFVVAPDVAFPGWFESSIYDTRSSFEFGEVLWTSEGGKISVQARSSNNREMWGATPWEEADTAHNGQDMSSLNSVSDGDRFFQCRVGFRKEGAIRPVLHDICMGFTAPYDTTPPVLTPTGTVWSDSNAWFGGPYEMVVEIVDDMTGVDGESAWLHWTNGDWQQEQAVQMEQDGDTFRVEIPEQAEGDSVCYYLEALDFSFQVNQGYSPSDYPSSIHSFRVVPEPPRFSYTTVRVFESERGPYAIYSRIRDACLDGSSVRLRWRVNGGPWSDTLMNDAPAHLFMGEIPALDDTVQAPAKVEYYLSASDLLGQSRTDPEDAPDSVYSFEFTSVNEDEVRNDIADFQVFQNSPNPFSGRTVIPYELPATADVEITLFDCTGRKVRTLRHERQGAGAYTLTWDGRDSSGRLLPEGVYFCRIEVRFAGHVSADAGISVDKDARDCTETLKMLLLR